MDVTSSRVTLTELTKQYGSAVAVERVNLDIAPGSLVALLGPSGCGKTTCLRMISGLVTPSSGDILVNGRSITHVPTHRRNIGMLFQNYALFPHLTVEQNVAFGLQLRKMPKAAVVQSVAEALGLVQLAHLKDRLPTQLSGGQQQRVALARALVIQPSMLLLDEPLGALDKALRESMQVELRALQRRLGITTVMVTHDQDEALTMADQIVIMNHGKLEQIGTPAEVYQRPVSRFVANFVGVSNFFTGQVEQSNADETRVRTGSGATLLVPHGAAAASRVTVAVRPEAIKLSPADGLLAPDEANAAIATVEQVIYRGYVRQYHLALANGEPLIAFDQSRPDTEIFIPASGSSVVARWSTSSNHVVTENAA